MNSAPTRTLLVVLVGAMVPSAGWSLDVRDRYEEALVSRALRQTQLLRHPNPHGKIIDRVVIVREDIIAQADPWPDLLNIVHITTKQHVIHQELLLDTGDLYDAARIAESERNLRSLFILSVARIVPCRAARRAGVILLVVTKDLWSLRLNMAYSQTGSLVSAIDFFPTEENFLGRNKRLSLRVGLSQLELSSAVPYPLTLFATGEVLHDRVIVGQAYLDRRLLGTRLRLQEQVDLHIDGRVPCGGSTGDRVTEDPKQWCPARSAGALSGIAASVVLERPLFSLATQWGFRLVGQINARQTRFYRQNSADPLDRGRPPGERPGVSLEALAFEGHPDGQRRNVPHVYDQRVVQGSAVFTRSEGKALKHDLFWGFLAYEQDYDPPDDFSFDATTEQWFVQSVLPRSESAALLLIGYQMRPTTFVRLQNIRTFALSEDYALGPDISLELRFAQNLERFAQPFIEVIANALYRGRIGGHLFAASVAGTTRYHRGLSSEPPSQQQADPWVNQRLELALQYISAPILIARLNLFSALVLRKDDLDRGFSRLGGAGNSATTIGGQDNDRAALRGYPSSHFTGRNLFRFHGEIRSHPINLWTMHLGAVLFYEGGSAWGRPGPGRADSSFRYRQSVGLGLRLLFPQFNRETIRADLGIPLERDDAGSLGSWFTFSFGQVF